MNPAFTLPFLGDDEQIRRQIQRGEKDYFKRPVRYAANSKEADEMALSAGTRIREGERTKENLKVIFHWKNESSRFYKSKLEPAFDRNHADCVARALRLALGMHNPEIALYRSYNDACLGLAKQFSVCVRTLDRALWEWGKTHTPKRPLRTSGA
jgi:hypothetical protein